MSAHRGVRLTENGWELRCESCSHGREAAFWPLTLEFWNPQQGMTRCRACWTAKHRDRRRTGRGGHLLSAPAQEMANLARRAYQREWSARKRAEERADEGRKRYQRRAA